MRVKKYLVETMPEAMSQIRQELGKDAVIVSTKEVKTGGILGMFRKRAIEVVAAVDEQAKPTAKSSTEPNIPPVNGAMQSYVPSSVARSMYGGGGSNGQSAINVERGTAQPQADAAGRMPQSMISNRAVQPPNSMQTMSADLEEESTAVPWTQLPFARSERAVMPMTSIEQDPTDPHLQKELAEMKRMMRKVMERVNYDSWSESAQEVERHLRLQGLSQEAAYGYVQQAWEQCKLNREEEPDSDVLRGYVKDIVEEKLQSHVVHGLTPATRILYVVGPTGVGKTTTIAKLAADQMFHHQRKVGLIASDTYRIAAVEQLRTYASILNVPMEVVTSPNDTERALRALQGCDLIIMDTAGRNFRNDMYVNELNTMLKPFPDSETFLVLSLTSKTEDMIAILERFSRQRIDRIIFTKADETDTFGSVLELADRTTIPFSYITTGQNVPDDIEPFQVDEAVRRIVGA
ncbi:flagellar biosynthesis protein FlhF [Paenibacillus sp. cl6col]|uniref:Flagellar biosynthesis protein FlhF n=1 Tax=Paenibacillus alvei TaxID=44250 RepID=A0ABT4EBT2_PAEAL|nr:MULTISPECIES: flagellar biosynthesis protein FlhF [Paenibacillus]EPY10046.1 gtp-binding signal recognition srp54 g [Paenibacillus alvei A6-6i-x]MCY9531202.1 flagellar biosynthesis protein FlhF [Paenibacillus alvei]SDE99100.1 flagellar biosynthesis protein FlhF [Paenibacillus sp. cl6col]